MAKIMDEKEVASALSSDLPYCPSTVLSGVGQGDAAQTGGAIVGLFEGGRNGGDAGGSLKENSAEEGLKVGDAGEGSKAGDAGEGSKGGNAGEGLKGGNAGGLQKGDAAESLQGGDAGIGLGNVGEGPKGGDAGEGNAGGDIVNDRAVGGANDGIQATGEANNEVEAPESSNGDAGEGNVNQSIEEIIYESDDDGVWEGSYSGSTTSINRGQRTTGIRFGDCNNNRPARDRNPVRNYDQVTVNDGSGDENATHERRPYSRYPDYPDSRNNSDDEMSEYLYEYEENIVRRPHTPREEQAAVGRVGRIRGRRRSRAVTNASPNVNKNKKRFGIRL